MLASIQQVLEVAPIEGADRIERVKILGWDCVVKKGTFAPNDLCVYIEIDTLIPKWLLTDDRNDTEIIRLRTVKMRKQISQGLVLPLTVLDWTVAMTCNVGDDVSELLGITHYEKPIPINMQGEAKGNFPAFLRKTDEIRIQAAPEFIELLHGKPYYITQKVDGSSATCYKYKGVLGVCSRNFDLVENENNTFWKMAYKYNLADTLPEGYCIQAELCGPGVQDNRLGLTQHQLFVFSVFVIRDQQYIYPLEFFSESAYLPTVDVVDRGMCFEYTLDELLQLAKRDVYPISGTMQEGIVVRSYDQSISFKVANNNYLLKYSE